ncbi:MAG: hypothetical protein K1Y02_04450 [Candidatus Hydrogenedentes bacterium]|nr:hypothetical protein [Candidatus Hydrogenedentota bacterium]
MDSLTAVLRSLRFRLTVRLWLSSTSTALLIAFSLACIWMTVTKLFPMLGDSLPVGGSLTALGVLWAVVYTYVKRPSLLQAAILADERLGLQERLTSSLELAEVHTPMVDAVHEDARAHLGKIILHRDFPVGMPRRFRYLTVPILVFALGYVLLPEFDLLGQRAREAEAKQHELAMKEHAERLRLAAQPVKEAAAQNDEQLQELAEEVERIAEKLEGGELSQKQATAKLSNVMTELAERQEKLGTESKIPKMKGDTSRLDLTKELAQNIQKGNFDKAAEEAQKMLQKLQAGEMAPADQEKLAEELKELSKLVGGENSELGKALANISSGLSMKDMQDALKNLEKLELSLEDLKALSEQMKKLQACMGKFADCRAKMCEGDFEKFCAYCNGKGCGQCGKQGLGMRGPGQGQGNTIGELPDVDAQYDPSMLSGDMTKGKILADLMQRAAPQKEGDAERSFTSEALIQVQQQSEQALTKEEIPVGAREYVRQYFGSLEPDSATTQQ